MAELNKLKKGSFVEICGLSACSELNGMVGSLHNFDLVTSRWEVEILDPGFKKVKEVNLKLLKSRVTKKKKMCRFGQNCHRPDCWFAHSDEASRCAHFAALWQNRLQPLDQGKSAITPALANDSNERQHLRTLVDKLQNDVSAQEQMLQASLADIQTLKQQTSMFAQERCTEEDVNLIADELHNKTSLLEHQLVDLRNELVESTASLHKQLYAMKEVGTDSGLCVQDQIAALLSGMQQDMTTQVDILQADMDDRLGAKLNTRMLETLQAAVTPLAEFVSEKMLTFEHKIHALACPDDDGG